MQCKRIYVAATSQHVGKTTSTLGLVHTLKESGLKVGYCKPVGQQFISIAGGKGIADKDAHLFSSSAKFELVPELHSPVILGPGATTAFLDNPAQYPYSNKILKASKILDQHHDIVVYEGTGHPGVGSVVNLSNDRVAELLNAGVIMVVEAGIGSTIDSLYLNLSVFEKKGIPIFGVIINKAYPSKIDKIRRYVGSVLKERDISLLGILPYEEELGLPVMATIARTLKAKIEYNEDQLDNRVGGIIAGSLIDISEVKQFENQLLVVSINRLADALKKLNHVVRMIDSEKSPLSGIILNGKGEIAEEYVEYFLEHNIPVLRSQMDTYECVIKISRIEVKINRRTPWKVKKAINLFREHVDLAPVLAKLNLTHQRK